MTIELNYSDDINAPYINSETRRYSQLAQLLRAHTLLDIDCWSAVYGNPLQPGRISRVIIDRVIKVEGEK
jgi:2-oxoglutarate ferredoxin oxidoreductase subunit alpha